MRTTKPLSCLVAIALAAICLTPSIGAQEKAVNIGLVDMERIFGEFYKTKLAEGEVEKVKEIIKVEVEERRQPTPGCSRNTKPSSRRSRIRRSQESVRKGHQTKAEAKGRRAPRPRCRDERICRTPPQAAHRTGREIES